MSGRAYKSYCFVLFSALERSLRTVVPIKEINYRCAEGGCHGDAPRKKKFSANQRLWPALYLLPLIMFTACVRDFYSEYLYNFKNHSWYIPLQHEIQTRMYKSRNIALTLHKHFEQLLFWAYNTTYTRTYLVLGLV